MARRQKMPVCVFFVQDPRTKSTGLPAINVTRASARNTAKWRTICVKNELIYQLTLFDEELNFFICQNLITSVNFSVVEKCSVLFAILCFQEHIEVHNCLLQK